MSTANNSFIKMQEEDELNFPPPPEIEENLTSTLHVLSMMGYAMELFIPKALEMFVLTMGGTIKEIETEAKDELPSGAPSNDVDDDAPGSAGAPPEE